MSSADPPWVKDSKGHYYQEVYERGKLVRRYEDELEKRSSSNRASQSTRHKHETTPRASTRSPSNVDYGTGTSAGASSHSNRRRRESISYKDAEDSVGGSSRTEAIQIYNQSRPGYHGAGGYGRSRDEPRDNSPQRSTGSGSGRRHDISYQREYDENELSHGISKLKLEEAYDQGHNYIVSASAPAASGKWGSLATRRDSFQAPIYENEGRAEDFALRRDVTQDLSIQDYKRKVEAIPPSVPPAPPETLQGKRVIRGTPGNTETLDESYRVRNLDWEKFFRPGRVFSTLWTDAYAGKTNESEDNQFTSLVKYGERVHSKIRRFVVVKYVDRCCLCIPVTTYNGTGAGKRGIKLHEHGLIYSGDKRPTNERGITAQPLRVKLSKGAERIKNPSYINYGRVYTVETNVKVKDVGDLDYESRKLLRTYWNQVNILQEEDFDTTSAATNPQARSLELTGVGGGVTGSPYTGGPNSQAPLYGSANPASPSRIDYNTPGHQDHSSSYNQYGTQWAPSSSQYPPHNPPGMYNSTATTRPTTIRYATAPTFDMQRGTSSSNYQGSDSRFAQPSQNDANAYSSIPNYAYEDVGSHSARRPAPFTSSYNSAGIPAHSNDYARFNSYDDRGQGTTSGSDSRYPDQYIARDPYPPSTSMAGGQPTWSTAPVASSRIDPAYSGPSYTDNQYSEQQAGNESIDLPTLEEARASRQRRESTGGRAHGTNRDRDDRYRKKR